MRLKHFLSVFLTLLTLSVGQMWGTPTSVTINLGTTTNYWNTTSSTTFTDSYTQQWSEEHSVGGNGSVTTDASYIQYGNGSNKCNSFLFQTTAKKAFTLKTFTVTVAGSNGGGTPSAGTISLMKGTTTLRSLDVSGTSSATCSITSEVSVSKDDVLKVSYSGSRKGMRISQITYSYEETSSCTNPSTLLSISSSNTATLGTDKTLTTSGGNNGTVTWTVAAGTGSATIVSGNTLHPTSAGTVTVTATQDDNNGKCGKVVNQTITINKAVATITLSEAGETSSVSGTYYGGDSYTLPSSTTASCGDKVLVGWSTVEVAETNTKPSSNYYDKGASATLSAGSNTFYAVFAKAGGSGGTEYVLTAASAVNAGTYIIAAYDATNSKYVTLTGATSGSTNVDLANETTGVTLTNNKFTTAPTNACEFTLAGNASDGFTIKNADANGYLGYTAQGTSRRLAFGNDYSTYTWKVGELEYDNYTTGCYIHRNLSSNYTISANGSSTTFIRGYSGSTKYKPIYFFKKTSTVTYTKYATSCCQTLGQINGSVSVSQTSAVVKLASAYAQVANADAYQLKVVGSSNYNDWTDVDKANLTTSVGVTVNGLTCGTDYTAYLRAKGSGSYCDFGTESSVNFTTSKYSISVADGITNGTIAANKATECPDETVTLTVTPSSAGNGYHLASWSLNGVAQDVNTLSFTMPASNVTITGTFEANNVPMAINVTATDKATVTTSAASALAGANITLSCTNVADGYQFFGWTVTAGGNTVTVTNPTSATGASFTMPAAVTTVTADIRQMVTVTFMRDGSEYDSQTTYVGGTVTFPSNPSKFDNDYPNFIGWADAISGIATSAPTLKSASDAITANVEYHAVFANAPQPVNSYEKVTTTGDMVNNCKYVIAAWDAAESKYYAATGSLTGNGYNLDKVDISSKVSNNIVSAPANSEVWKATIANSKVQFQNVGNSKYMSAVVNDTHTNFTLTDNSGEEYTYSVSTGAWTFTTSSLTNNKQIEYYDDAGKDYFSYYTAQDAPIYLFKQQYSQEFVTRQVVSYTITYDKNTTDEVTGTIPTYPSAVSGSSHTISSAELGRAGYNFLGWNTNKDATTAQTGSVTISENTTFYAIWEVIPTYDIEFSVNGAPVAALKIDDILQGDAISFPDAAAITAASAFPATDKKFMGWIEASSYASDVAPTFVTSATAAADKTYYAVFADVEDGGYEKVTSELDDWSGEYILAYDNSATEAYVFTGVDAASNYVTAEVSSNTIEELPTGGVTITIASFPETTNYSIMVNGGTNDGKYLQGSSSNGLSFQATAQETQIAWDNTNGLLFVNSSSYMRFNANTNNYRFRYYKSATYTQSGYETISLYKLSVSASDYVTAISPLSSIAITTAPTKTVYKKGEMLSLTSMVVTATYENSRTRAVTNYTVTPNTTTTLAPSNVSFTVSYTEGAITRTDDQAIHVYDLSGIAITTPTKTTYNAGETFDPAGMTVTATWGGSALDKIAETVDSYTYSPNTAFVNETDEDINVDVTISYTHEGVTKTATQVVTVHPLANLTMTWNVAGETSTSKIYVNAQDKYLLALPADPEVPEAFGSGYEFIGWTSANSVEKDGSDFTAAVAGTEMSIATEFHAVFAQVNAPFFKETFDDCDGTGGNSGGWSGSIATNTVPESISSTWTLSSAKAADECLKLGSGDAKGSAQTPSFSLTGSATLTFKAGAWNSNNEGTTLNISANGATLKQNDAAVSSVTMTKGAWTTYTVDVTDATGTVTIKFEANSSSNNRFFLDEVMVKRGNEEYKDYRFVPSSVTTPVIGLAEATYYGAQNATITQAQEKQIFYSLDGNTWTEYTAPVALDQAGAVTLYAKAYDEDQDDYSSVVSKSYTIVTEIDAPTMTASCVFIDDQTVTISHDMSGTEGFALQYSYDGENYTAYTEALTVTETTTIYAKATIGSLEATANATYTKGHPVDYTKVTSAAGLAIGQQFIIKAVGVNAAAGALDNNILAAVDIPAEVTNTITLINQPVTVFELGGRSGAYTLISDSKYLKYKSDKKLEYSATVADTWTITYSDGTPTITNKGQSSYDLLYNSGSPRFTVYSSAQTAVAIYAKAATVYTLTVKDYDGSNMLTEKVVEGGSFFLTAADEPTSTPGANYEFLDKWTDGTNMYAVGEAVTVSAATTLQPCWKVTTPAATQEEPATVDAGTLPASVQDVVVTENVTLTVNSAKTLDNLTVEAGGKVSLSSNKLTVVGTFAIKTQMASGASGQLTGATASNFAATDQAYIDITLGAGGTNQQWHAFTVPFPVDVMNGIYDLDDNKLTNETNYAIMEYFGDLRAQGKYGWKKIRTTLVPGTFYIMATDGYRTTYRFKKKAGAALVAENSKEIFKFAASGDGVSTDAGWNGVGNPTLTYGKVGVEVQVLDPESYTFVKKDANSTNFVVGTPFFYQAAAAGSISMSAADAGASYAPRRVAANGFEKIKVAFGNEEFTDYLDVSASEEALNEYQIGKDLAKMTMTNTPKVAQIFGKAYNTKLCMVYAPMSNDKAEVALELYAPNAGTYTISVPAERDDASLYLTHEGNIIWDLTISPYEVELGKGATNEYGLMIVRKAPQVTTGIETVTGDGLQVTGVQKIVINDHVFILRGGQMFDVTGKAVK